MKRNEIINDHDVSVPENGHCETSLQKAFIATYQFNSQIFEFSV